MILSLLLWIVVGLLAAIVIVICTPIRIQAKFDTDEIPPIHLRIGVFGGLLPIPTSSKKRKKDKKPRKPREPGGFNIVKSWPHILRSLPKLLSRLFTCIKIVSLKGHLKLGLPDPADTGQLYGLTYPVMYHLNKSAKNEFIFHPDFDQASAAAKGHIILRVIPAGLIPPILGFGWTAFVKPKLRSR